MEPMGLIMGALGAAAGMAAEGAVQEAAKDGYNRLKELIMGRFKEKGNAVGETVLPQYESDPGTWEKPLQKSLAEAEADKDQGIVSAAQELLDKLKASPGGEKHVQNAVGNYIARSDRGSTSTVKVNQP
ncbi:hypothetical protein QUF80_20600 [Desulfococcaceae bacterium HSG8]|nr:hypothetical protein [Desulfococcaceae bacterium HSG8]